MCPFFLAASSGGRTDFYGANIVILFASRQSSCAYPFDTRISRGTCVLVTAQTPLPGIHKRAAHRRVAPVVGAGIAVEAIQHITGALPGFLVAPCIDSTRVPIVIAQDGFSCASASLMAGVFCCASIAIVAFNPKDRRPATCTGDGLELVVCAGVSIITTRLHTGIFFGAVFLDDGSRIRCSCGSCRDLHFLSFLSTAHAAQRQKNKPDHSLHTFHPTLLFLSFFCEKGLQK